MVLMFKQKMFSWFGKFEIFDENEQVVYTVHGKPALGKKLLVSDASGAEIAEVRQELFHMMPHYKFIVGGKEEGEMRGKFHIGHPVFELDFCQWEVVGNFWQLSFDVTDANGGNIMQARQKMWHLTDTYSLDIADPQNALMCVLIVLAIDAWKAEQAAVSAAGEAESKND